MIMEAKPILDACCGSKMFWFDKENPNVLFADIRDESHVLCDGRKLEVSPDMQIDFRDMPFQDNHIQAFEENYPDYMGKFSMPVSRTLEQGRTDDDDYERFESVPPAPYPEEEKEPLPF